MPTDTGVEAPAPSATETNPVVQPSDPLAELEPVTSQQTSDALAKAAESDNVASAKETAEVRHKLLIDGLFADNDPRKESASMLPPGISEKALIEQTTLYYIKNLTAGQHVSDLSVEEAATAFTQIALEIARQQSLVDQAKTNGEPIPEGIIVDDQGKVKIDEAKVAADSIKAPRILHKIDELKKEGLEHIFCHRRGIY